jgi:hypothetical protein
MTAVSAREQRTALRCAACLTTNLAPLVVLFVITLLLIPPIGDFPLNDDWIFFQEVKTILDEGRYVHHPFSAPTAVAQSFWGAGFASVFGLNYNTLRGSTLVLALVAAWATSRCAAEAGAARGAALMAGAALLANPIFLNMAYTFNTDASFLAPLGLSLLYFVRSLRTRAPRDIFLGSAFSALAFFVRQFGLLPAAAYFLFTIVALVREKKSAGIKDIAAFVSPWLCAGVALAVMAFGNAPGYTWSFKEDGRGLAELLVGWWQFTVIVSVYLGLFALPITSWRVGRLLVRPMGWRRGQWLAFALYALVIWLTLRNMPGRHMLPFWGNIITDFRIGPTTLEHTGYFEAAWSVVRLGTWWIPITVTAVLSTAVFLVELGGLLAARSVLPGETPVFEHERRCAGFLSIALLLQIAALLNPFVPGTNDRYLLPIVQHALILTAVAMPVLKTRIRLANAISACALLANWSMSLVGLQDYMAWNTARWRAVDILLHEKRVDPLQIDAGFEYQGVYTSAEYMKRNNTTDFWNSGSRGFWILDDTYAVTFWPRDGYEEIGHVPYWSYLGRNDVPVPRSRWIRMGERYIFILKRSGESSSTTHPPDQ